jgi:DNA-binding MurR/RpiR family transcriptional regulator
MKTLLMGRFLFIILDIQKFRLKMTLNQKPDKKRGDTSANDIVRIITCKMKHMSATQCRVANVILADPLWVVHANIDDLAARASVSPPTIIRFSRTLGCSGLKDFKIRLAGAMALGTHYLHRSVRPDDSTSEILRNVASNMMSMVADWRDRIDPMQMERAASAIHQAHRIDCFGVGMTSYFLAQDMQARLFRLGLVSNAFLDAHYQLVAATSLTDHDVLVAISYIGRMPVLLNAVRIGRERNATVIALTHSQTPLAELADILLPVDVQEGAAMRVDTDAYIVQLLLIEMLMVLVGLRCGPTILPRLEDIHQVLQTAYDSTLSSDKSNRSKGKRP